ncbi:MAG: long-chain acyl-CoA synthetase [Saprospiraceae bacterium]|jgi:long-chain acyl-CoA synthetase
MRYDNIQGLFEGVEGANIHKKVYVQIAGIKFTYKQLLEDVNKLCNHFQSNGLTVGDRIILSVNDDYYTALFFLAFLKYGIVTIFLDPEVPVKRATAVITKTDAQGFVMDELLYDERNIPENANQFQLKVKKNLQKKGRLFKRLIKSKNADNNVIATTFPAILDRLIDRPISLPAIKSSDLAYVLFTSGTTSDPKGVMINHGNLFAQLHTLSKVYAFDDQTRLHNILPLYNTDGCIQGTLLTIYNHATWLRPMRFDLSKISELFHSFYKYRASHFFCVPLIISLMDKFSENYEDSFLTEDFKFIISSASKLEKKLWVDFERKFKVPLVNVYGMTETVAAALYCSMNDYPRKTGTTGVPIDCEAKIINADGNIAKENEDGVLWLKGENVFAGYFNNPEATAAVLVDGWLNTGDVAVKDEQGFYSITGRVRNMINSGGVNIYPEQVSEMINSQPAVLENICLGIKDENFGEKLVSAVVLVPDSKLDKLELLSFLRPLLKHNQIPKDIFFLDHLPKGISGKIQINAVEKLITNFISKPTDTSDKDYQKVIRESASEAFGIAADKITMEDTAQSIDGWDSMAHLMFVTTIEKHFNIRFSTSEMMTMNSMNATSRILKKKFSAK